MTPRHILLAFLALLALGPVVLPPFYVTLLNYIGLYALVALGLVLLTGVGGGGGGGGRGRPGSSRPTAGSPGRARQFRSCSNSSSPTTG